MESAPIIFKRKKHKDILTNNIDLLHQKTMINASLNSEPSSTLPVASLPSELVVGLQRSPDQILTNKQGVSSLILMKSQDNKTKKKQKSLSTFDKSKLWDVFDKDIQTQYNTDVHKHNSELECVYNGQGSASEACNLEPPSFGEQASLATGNRPPSVRRFCGEAVLRAFTPPTTNFIGEVKRTEPLCGSKRFLDSTPRISCGNPVLNDHRSSVGTEGSNLEHLRCSEEKFGGKPPTTGVSTLVESSGQTHPRCAETVSPSELVVESGVHRTPTLECEALREKLRFSDQSSASVSILPVKERNN